MYFRTVVLGVLLAISSWAWGQAAKPAAAAGPGIAVANGVALPIVLRSVRIDAQLSGAFALTSVELVFHNPNGAILEGELQFPLLEGQVVVGMALDINGALRDAVPVDKARGQAIFEDVTRARIDPALLEATQGNSYKLRVYPLPAFGERRVVLHYVETLAIRGGQRTYRLPLEYAARLQEFSLALRVSAGGRPRASGGLADAVSFRPAGDRWVADLKRSGFTPRGVLQLAIAGDARARPLVQRYGDGVFFHVEVPVREKARQLRKLPRVVQLVWDSSGSSAGRQSAHEFALLDAYFRAARDIQVRLVRVRDAAEAVSVHTVAGGDWKGLRKTLEATTYDGATNLAAAPADAAAGEVLLFSDGLGNFGDARLAPRSVPVFAVTSQVQSDAAALRRMAEATGGRFIDLTVDTAAEARHKLLATTTRVVSATGEGLRDVVVSPFPVRGRIVVWGRMRADAPARLSITVEHANATREEVAVGLPQARESGRFVATTWAMALLRELEADYDTNRGEIRRLGRQFNLATRETSLIVLDRIEDYVRYEIEPPGALAGSYASILAANLGKRAADKRSQLEDIVKLFEERQGWWDKSFPKDTPPPKEVPAAKAEERARPAGAVPAASAPLAARVMASPARVEEFAKAGKPASSFDAAIRLRPWAPDAPYARRMRAATPEAAYGIYLDERPDYTRSTAFFLDAADILFEKALPDLAVRVLSNLAEMDLENRHILRILGYRLLQAGKPGLAIPVFRKVLALSPEEPQSFRDLGLALAAAGEFQPAVDLLHEVVVTPWNNRFPEVELIALAELNAIVASSTTPIDVSRIDRRLLRNLPLDVRVVLTWDADNTDIDLWVTDPNGEKAYYGHRLTYQGGRMSLDFTGGYGPEEFSLRSAKAGIYKVQANFYGHRQQTVAGATTLQAKLITGFGTPRQHEQIVTLRLSGKNEVIDVGEFEVR